MQQKTPSPNDNWEYVLESDRLIFVKTSNEASEKVAEMAGFTKEETFIKHYNGKDMEHILYSKINA